MLLAGVELHTRFYEWVHQQLGMARQVGNVSILPSGYHSTSLFEHSWEQIHIQLPGLEFRLKKPVIQINFFENLSKEVLWIEMDSLQSAWHPTPKQKKSPPPRSLTLPDWWMPFRASIQIHHLRFQVPQAAPWEADSLHIVNRNQKSISLKVQSIRGPHMAHPMHLRTRLNWNQHFTDISLKLYNENVSDSLYITANAPRTHLEDLSCELDLQVQKLPAWLPIPWPAQAPQIGKVTLSANGQVQLLQKKFKYEALIKTRSLPFWQLPAFDAVIQVRGSQKMNTQASVQLKNAHGQLVQASVQLDSKLDGIADAEIQGISIHLGHEHLPTDLKLHRLVKSGDSLHATLTTLAGSEVVATLASFKNPKIQFQANIAPLEPWAVQWTHQHLKIAPPTLIEGEFKRGILSANVRTKLPFAYWAMAEQFETDLTLSSRGIHFDNGTIQTRGQTHSFSGEVMWNDSVPHFSFSLEQNRGRFANVYGTFDPILELSLAGIELKALPWADTSLLRGYNGVVTGIWKHHFPQKKGQAEVALTTTIQELPLTLRVLASQNQDSLIVNRLLVLQGSNQLEASALALLRRDSLATDSPAIRVESVQLSTHNFNIPELALAFKDSTLKEGKVSGRLQYTHSLGLQGGLSFSDLAFQKIDSSQLQISRLRLFTQGNNLQLSGRLNIGQGLWDGEAELTFDNTFTKKPHRFAGAYATDNGGVFWFDGLIDSLFKEWQGALYFNGPWFLPPGTGEIESTDLSANLRVPFKGGLDSIQASFRSKNTTYLLGTLLELPLELYGQMHHGLLQIDTLHFHNADQEKMTAQLLFDIPTKQLTKLHFQSTGYTLPLLGIHKLRLQNLSARTLNHDKETVIELDIPGLQYHLNDNDLGKAHASLRGQIRMHIPKKSDSAHIQANNTLEGQFEIDKAVYKKHIDIAPDPLHLDKTFNAIAKLLANLRKEKPTSQQAQAVSSRPTTLNIRVSDSGRDSVMVISNLATFPLSIDLTVLGTSQSPLLSGDINAVGNGFIGYDGVATFDINAFRLSWQDAPWRRGTIELQSSHDYPFCEEQNSEDTCPIELNVTGTLTHPQPQPVANCGIESSPAVIYYSILLGCVSQTNQSESFDKNKFTGRLLGNLLTSTANKGLGGSYIGDIDLKMKIFDNSAVAEKDSSYLRIPVSLDKWVKNLSAVFGYTQDQSINPRYDQSAEVGLQYTLPIFDPSETSMNLIDPRLDLSANLISRRYPATVETQQAENQLEKNIGLLYSYKFWDPCFLGFGNCTPLETPEPIQADP